MRDFDRQRALPGFETEAPPALLAVPTAAPDGPAPAVAAEAPESLAGQVVWSIDAHSLIHQVFHALPEMSSPRGEPVNAVFGFTRDILTLLEKKHPDFLFCTFDMPGKTFRHEMFAEYKVNRPAMPDDLAPQIAHIHRMLAALGVPSLGIPGYEADDLLATLAHMTERLGGRCMIVTGDKDCRQLITEHVLLYNIRKDDTFDRARLREEWGIRPDQVVDFQALVGDAVDNVPGVPLIGPKIARQLLEQFDTLEGIFAHADQVAGAKRRENLLAHREQALLSRQLAQLDRETPLSIDWTAGRVGRIDRDAALELCREFGFHAIARQIEHLAGRGRPHVEPHAAAPSQTPSTPSGEAAAGQPAPGGSDDATGAGVSADATPFDEREDDAARHDAIQGDADSPALTDSLGVSAASPPFECHLVDTPQVFARFLAELRQQSCISLDTETTDIRPRWAELVGLSFAWNDREAWYLPVRAPEGEARLDATTTLAALRGVLENRAVAKIGQNLKYDMVVLRTAGVRLAGIAFDSIIASYLLEAGERNHNLDELAKRHLGHTTIKIEELIGSGKKQRRMDEAPVRRVADYAGEDAMLPLRLRPILEERLQQAGLMELFRDVELPLIDVLAELEYTGVKVDIPTLEELGRRFGARMAELETQIYELAGRTFNIDSPRQLQKLLFDELHLRVVKRTPKTGPSTDAEVLEELAHEHPLPARIMEYRQYGKLKGTYIDALPRMVHPQTHRVHASFNQVVAATGRLSSSDPNLQNIPVRTEEGRAIRAAFVPGETGWTLLCADYSQIELRVLAHFADDENLRGAFLRDEDIHARVASQINGVPLDAVTPAMRRAAKAINFGVIYGQSPFGLSKALGIDKDAAAAFIESYFAGYPGIDDFLAQVLESCRARGYVTTILGRRRAIRGIRPQFGRQRNLPERTAINTVIQGSAADLIKLAMLRVQARIERERLPARMLLQIHDELIFETPTDQTAALAALVREEMSGVWQLAVPLKVDLKAGDNWAAAEEANVPL